MSQRKKPSRAADEVGSAVRPTLTTRPRAAIGALLIVVLSIVAYYPSLQGGFILDDDILLTKNYLIKAPDGLWRFWCTSEQPDYVPLASSTLWLEWRWWGMNPTGYRITNLALHVVACLLLWHLLRRLSIPGGFLAAVLFAVHPANVESVAWIEQRKNTLSMVLFLLSILWFVFDENRRSTAHRANEPVAERGTRGLAGTTRWYWLSLLAFALAMFSKGSVATLPLLLLLIVWWQHGRITTLDILRSAPFFLIAAVLTPVIIWFVTHGSEQSIRGAAVLQRLLGAGAVVWFYLAKAILPIQLGFVYPQWLIDTSSARWWLPLAAVLLVTIALICQRRRPWGRPLLFAWTFVCLALAPVLGFSDSGYARYSLVADHYQHLALLAVVSLAGAALAAWNRGARRSPLRWTPITIAVVVVGAFTTLAWHQSRLYADAITLYRDTLEKNPDCWMIHNNLGSALKSAGRIQEAEQQYESALRLRPDYAEALVNLATLEGEAGQETQALGHFQQALQMQPSLAAAHYNLANLLVKAGRLEEAAGHYQNALESDPNGADIHNNLGGVLEMLGRWPEAMDHYLHAVSADPEFVNAHYNLGHILIKANRPEQAIAHFQDALRLDPERVDAHYELGNALVQTNQLPAAIEQYQQTLRISPNHFWAHNNLGVALAETGQPQQAIEQFQAAVRLQPDFVDAWKNLAEALAKLGRTAEATDAAQKAFSLAQTQGQTALAQQIDDWLKDYRSGQLNQRPKPPPADTTTH